MWTVTYAFLQALAKALVANSPSGLYQGPLYGIWCGLCQAGTAGFSPQSTMVNVVEANYDGYSRQQVTWFPPFTSQAGPELLAAQDLFFEPTDALLSNQITGVFLVTAFYGGTLYAGAMLPVPGTILGATTNAIKVQPNISFSPLQVYGSPKFVY